MGWGTRLNGLYGYVCILAVFFRDVPISHSSLEFGMLLFRGSYFFLIFDKTINKGLNHSELGN